MNEAGRCGRAPQRTSRSCVLLALALAALVLAGGESEAAEHEIELPGAWHVTVHYRDATSGDPDAERWDDRVWRFEQRGSRLQWTEFPTVIFQNREGRFELGDGDRQKRILRFWEPSEAQAKEIATGLIVNPRGARSKGLRRDGESAYRSAGGLRAESASVIGYSESWRIEGLPAKPVFTRDDSMGSARTEAVQARTRYEAESVSANGDEVRGTYVRDDTQRGVFVMRRIAELIVLGSKQAEKERDDR